MEITSTEFFRDKHIGKNAYILGSGWSLTDKSIIYDLNDYISDGIVISCNLSITQIERCDYFLFTDESVPKLNYFVDGINKSDIVIYANPNLEYVSELYDNSILMDRRYEDRNFNFDIRDGKLICGTDCIHVATHFADILGCTIIYMLGVDLCWNGETRYAIDYNSDILKKGKDVFYTKDCFKTNGVDTHLETSYQSWVKIKNENPNKNIINTNPKGRLSELFPTIVKNNYNA